MPKHFRHFTNTTETIRKRGNDAKNK